MMGVRPLLMLLLLAPAYSGAVAEPADDLKLSPAFDEHLTNMAGMWAGMQKDIKEQGMKNEMEPPDIEKLIEHKKKIVDYALEHHDGDKQTLHKSELWKKVQKRVHSQVFAPTEDL